MTISHFERKLSQYADLTLQVGLNLQPGQRLLINAPLMSAPLVRKIAASAYQGGCRYVDVLWRDEQLDLIRHQHAPRDSFAEYPEYRSLGTIQHVQNGGAHLYIRGEDPDLLQGQNPDLIAAARKSYLTHMKPFYDLLFHNAFNWTVISYPTPPWAKKVFPADGLEARLERLWEAIFQVCRIGEDPSNAWQGHIADLQARIDCLTQKQYQALKFRAPGTDLTIGLAQGHRWAGGSIISKTGIRFTPNLPTEEVFTLPHRERIDGVVTASKPLSHAGALIENFSLTFTNGRVTQIRAKYGEEVLRKLIEADEGMASLGEVALVPYSSPVSKSGILFYDTLLDENAASHIALGDGLNFCLQNGESLSEEEYAARGGNTSLNHIDFMIGSAEMDVDGVLPDGTLEALMRDGEWAF